MSNTQNRLRQILNNPKFPKEQVLAFIKLNLNAGEYAPIIDRSFLLKAAKLKDVQAPNAALIRQRNAFDFTGDFKKELAWLSYNIRNFASTINSFIEHKLVFEKFFFLEKFENAENQLAYIKENFGESLWSIEMTLLLKEYKHGTKDNWSTLSDYLPQLNSPFYQFLINFYSKKIEKEMSYENCLNQFKNDFEDVDAEAEVTDYLVFKSLYPVDFEYNSLAGIIYVANIFGVIDQYLILMDLLAQQVSKTSENDKTIYQFLNQISTGIQQDSRITNMLNLISPSTEMLLLPKSNLILNLIETYSNGNYEGCLETCKNLIFNFPTSFEIYELYIRSLIHLNKPYENLTNIEFINNLCRQIYQASVCDSKSEGQRSILLKSALLLISFDFGKQLRAYTHTLQSVDSMNTWGIIGNLSSVTTNPKILSLNIAERYDSTYTKYYSLKDLASVKINSYISGKRESLHYGNLNQETIGVYRSRHFFSNQDYKLALENALPLLQLTIPAFYKHTILMIVYDSYVKLEMLRDAIQFGAQILIDDFYLSNIRFEELYQKVYKIGFGEFSDLISMPIIFSAIVKGYDLYVIYDEFMFSMDQDKPSQLDIPAIINTFNDKHVVYFLREICTITTLQHSLAYESIENAESERCEIYRILKIIDPKNIKIYDQEMADILKAGAVRDAIKEVDEGRLFVNVENLKASQSKGLKESFTRFKEIERFSKDVNLIGFNSSKERSWKASSLTEDEVITAASEETNKYNNPAFLAFKSMYIETREKFLFSKEYGLDSCLSTRIRHGALKNHIRSVFEKLNLITSKAGEKYLDNKRWEEQFYEDVVFNIKIQGLLKKFSKDIDDFTTFIVDSLIQIQTEKHTIKKDGLFNYSTSDKTLWIFMNEHKQRFISETDIVDILYTDLSNYTLRVLGSEIIAIITGDINTKFQDLIEKLQSEIRSFGLPIASDLLNNLSKSSTNIQTELENISEWFIFTTSESTSLLDIETVINASKEYTNRINPNRQLYPNIVIQCEPFVVYSHLLFVFNIMMTNIIEHSGLPAEKLRTEIKVSRTDPYIEIKFTNNFSTKINKGICISRLEAVKQNWNNHDKIDRSNIEGESGFDKIKRILLYEALAKSDKFEFSFAESSVSISLFLPFKEFKQNEDIDN